LTGLDAIAWAKVILALSVLVGASIADLRKRIVPDRFWIVLVGGGTGLLTIEILLLGPERPLVTLLSLSMPAIALVFVVWGYPELGKALKGSKEDLFFTGLYLLLLIGGASSYLFGDRIVAGKVLYSFIFMVIYFGMYTFPLLGARLLHGGADAKCMMSLAALFPWYGEVLPISFGPFYDTLDRIELLEYISPVHLGVLINGAFVTVLFLAIALPIRNILSGTFHPLRSWTSYWIGLDDVMRGHVWVIGEGGTGTDGKQDPTPELVMELRRKGVKRVRVTPKVPFILSLTVGLMVQVVLGNVVLAAMFLIG
jgi:hypothetical protein